MDALISFQSLEFQTSLRNPEPSTKSVVLHDLNIKDTKGNKWNYCGRQIPLQNINGTHFSALHVQLQHDSCS